MHWIPIRLVYAAKYENGIETWRETSTLTHLLSHPSLIPSPPSPLPRHPLHPPPSPSTPTGVRGRLCSFVQQEYLYLYPMYNIYCSYSGEGTRRLFHPMTFSPLRLTLKVGERDLCFIKSSDVSLSEMSGCLGYSYTSAIICKFLQGNSGKHLNPIWSLDPWRPCLFVLNSLLSWHGNITSVVCWSQLWSDQCLGDHLSAIYFPNFLRQNTCAKLIAENRAHVAATFIVLKGLVEIMFNPLGWDWSLCHNSE